MSGGGGGDAVPGSVDTWAPRRMSNESAEETPGPSSHGGGGGGALAGFGGAGGLFGSGGVAAGYTPGTGTGGGHFTQVVPVPAHPVPVLLSAGKGLEIGHGRHAHHGREAIDGNLRRG